ncbi:GAF domain-containing protein [Streptomyces sp. SID5468]|nr:GAF domain-containing protein [Streptomyces sp. SID5468]
MLRRGLDPDVGNHRTALAADALESLRRQSPLAGIVPTLREGLRSVADGERHVMAVADADGRVLWRTGGRSGRRTADRVNLAEGACWAEESAGTNGIGTAVVARTPLQITSTEHFVRAHHGWTCASAPLHDPRDGRLLGVVDISAPAAEVHPATLALVTAVARVAEGELRARHWQSVERLRSTAAPVLARLGGPAIAVDRYGWTAAVTGMAPVDRVALPATPQTGRVWLPSLGPCVLEPLPGGWLVRVGQAPGPAAPGRVVLELAGPRSWSVSVSGAMGSWSHHLSPRHAELLYVLALHREGRTAAQLAEALFGDPGRTVTVRAELSRLRRRLAGVLAHRPYRFADHVEVEVRGPQDPLDLLPFSTAPAVLAARRGRAAAQEVGPASRSRPASPEWR